MVRIAFLFALIFTPFFSIAMLSEPVDQPVSHQLKKQLLGTPVYIQVFKEERMLELYGKIGHQFRLLGSYQICNFSGGLGPKRRQGDFKSPEGFYNVRLNQLKPDSRFYRAINLGFPNQYDREQGYDGDFLMIHGECVSVGCYAMTNAYMREIFNWVDAALRNGQSEVQVSIYPFRMTESNMLRHRNSYYASFWHQLQPGYQWFEKYHQPPSVTISAGKYVLNSNPPAAVNAEAASRPFLALSQTKSGRR